MKEGAYGTIDGSIRRGPDFDRWITYFATARRRDGRDPAFIGGRFPGLVSLRTEWRSYGLYAAAAGLVVVLALGTLRGTFGLLGGEVSSATVINAVLLVASVGFVALCVRDLRSRNRGYGAR